jgi:hypothetical protein
MVVQSPARLPIDLRAERLEPYVIWQNWYHPWRGSTPIGEM